MKTILNAIGCIFITVLAIICFCIELPIKLGCCLLTIAMYVIALMLFPILSKLDVTFTWFRPIYDYSMSTKFITSKIIDFYSQIFL